MDPCLLLREKNQVGPSEALSSEECEALTEEFKREEPAPLDLPPSPLFTWDLFSRLNSPGPSLEKSAARFAFLPRKEEKEFDAEEIKTKTLEEVDSYKTRVDAPRMLQMAAEIPTLLASLGFIEEAAEILEAIGRVYDQVGSPDYGLFAAAQAEFLRGRLETAEVLLKSIPDDSRITPQVKEFQTVIAELLKKQARIEKAAPHIAALEQIRMRVDEQLEFDQTEKARRTANEGIDILEAGLLNGRWESLGEAFEKAENLPGFLNTGDFSSGPEFRSWLERMLKYNHGDVDRLIAFSRIKDESEREAWLLGYTRDLRDHFGSLDGYPIQTLVANLTALIGSKDEKVRSEATELLREVLGEKGITGLNDAEYAALLREGAKAALPIAVVGMIAGPLGAYAEGMAAGADLTLAGRTVWSGMNAAGRASLLARGFGFAVEGAAFWAGHDALHSAFIGGGDYFSGHGLARTYLMLGGLKVLSQIWHGATSPFLIDAMKASPRLTLPLGAASKTGEFLTEWAGFVALGRVESWVGLIPAQETTLRKEIAQAAIGLIQLKLALAAGRAVTKDLSTIKTIEIKLDQSHRLFQKALERGILTKESFQESVQQIFDLQNALSQLQGLRPAYAMAEGFSNDPMLSEKHDKNSKTPTGPKELSPRPSREQTVVIRKGALDLDLLKEKVIQRAQEAALEKASSGRHRSSPFVAQQDRRPVNLTFDLGEIAGHEAYRGRKIQMEFDVLPDENRMEISDSTREALKTAQSHWKDPVLKAVANALLSLERIPVVKPRETHGSLPSGEGDTEPILITPPSPEVARHNRKMITAEEGLMTLMVTHDSRIVPLGLLIGQLNLDVDGKIVSTTLARPEFHSPRGTQYRQGIQGTGDRVLVIAFDGKVLWYTAPKNLNNAQISALQDLKPDPSEMAKLIEKMPYAVDAILHAGLGDLAMDLSGPLEEMARSSKSKEGTFRFVVVKDRGKLRAYSENPSRPHHAEQKARFKGLPQIGRIDFHVVPGGVTDRTFPHYRLREVQFEMSPELAPFKQVEGLLRYLQRIHTQDLF